MDFNLFRAVGSCGKLLKGKEDTAKCDPEKSPENDAVGETWLRSTYAILFSCFIVEFDARPPGRKVGASAFLVW